MAHGPFAVVSNDLIRNKKFKRLRRILGVEGNAGIKILLAELVLFWQWCATAYPSGVIEGEEDEFIDEECLAEYETPFVVALFEAGFVTVSDGGYIVNDWQDHTGKIIKERDGTRDRKRRQRERENGGSEDDPTPPKTGRPRDVTVTSPHVTVESERESESEREVKTTSSISKIDDRYFESQFLGIWNAWQPAIRRSTKKSVKKALKAALKKISFEALIQAVQDFAASPYIVSRKQAAPQFIKLLPTWLNAEGWTEDRDAWQAAYRPGGKNKPVSLFSKAEASKEQYKHKFA